ncbi:MAG: hypothetical protein ACKON9_30105, partial [Planctomycetaceae bacterium]
VPQYLGLGPAAYFRREFQFPGTAAENAATYPGPQLMNQLQRLGVTHLLTTEPIAAPATDLQLLRSEPDAFLNRVWGRGGEPCFLYRLNNSPGRLQAEPANVLQQVTWVQRLPTRTEFEVTTTAACTLALADLNFPGWSVQVLNSAGIPVSATATTDVTDDFHRTVAGRRSHSQRF